MKCPTCGQHVPVADMIELISFHFAMGLPKASRAYTRLGHTIEDLRDWWRYFKKHGSMQRTRFWLERYKNPGDKERIDAQDDELRASEKKTKAQTASFGWKDRTKEILCEYEDARKDAPSHEEISAMLKEARR